MLTRPIVVHHPDYECDLGAHVFPTRKYRAVLERLAAEGLLDAGGARRPEPAAREELLAVHSADYLDDLEQLRWSHRTAMSELPLTAAIVRAYVLAAGGTLAATRDALVNGVGVHVGGGFHHAFADRAEGFCYINDLALAVRVLQREGRVRRAAVVDLDVHQGNGTARIFEGDPDVFTLSLHQERNYPSPKQHSTLDMGLEDGTGDETYLAALGPALERVWAHGPEVVLYQAGADPYRDDLLGGLALTLEGLEARDRAVIGGCAAHGIPLVVTLGGGYARRVEDTVAIHAATCGLALRPAGARRAS